jgi:hypothetical protein
MERQLSTCVEVIGFNLIAALIVGVPDGSFPTGVQNWLTVDAKVPTLN